MRGEASRIADRVSRDSLAPRLRDSGEDAWRIGNELFTITNALDHNVQLERALTDPSRPVEDKVAVVKTLIGDEAHPLTMEMCIRDRAAVPFTIIASLAMVVLLVVFSPFRDGVAGHVIAAIAGLLSAICATTVMLGNVIFPAGLDGGKSFSMEEAWIAGVGGLLIVLIIVSVSYTHLDVYKRQT